MIYKNISPAGYSHSLHWPLHPWLELQLAAGTMKQWQRSSIRILGLAATATAFFVTSAMADVKTDTTGRTFEKVELTEPLNWLAGKSLFPGRVIAGYNANLDEYNAESWVQHVLEQGKAHKACTSVLAFQGAFPSWVSLHGRT